MNGTLRFFVFAMVFAGGFFAQAQSFRTIENPTLWQDFTYDMGSLFKGVGHAYTRPLYWQGDDFRNAGLVTVGTLGLYAFDQEIQPWIARSKNDVPQLIRDYGWYSGSPQNMYGAQGIVYFTGLFTKNQKLRRAGVLMLSSSTATGFLQQLLKSLTGRARPDTGLGKNYFEPFGNNSGLRSFPSGHAILTFTAAHSLAKQFENPWVKGGIYTLGVIPGLTRILGSKHWASDVVLSWALSYFMVNAIDMYLDSRYDEKYNDTGTSTDSKLSVSFGGGGVGIVYAF